MNSNIKLKKETLKLVKDGMRGVVNEPGGTAYGSRLQNVAMCGKTGTAQTASLDKGGHDHAWFIAYAPSEEPAIAITALVEHGGHGSSAAAPIAKAITENLFRVRTEIKEAKAHENR